jgi:hypothetical protein
MRRLLMTVLLFPLLIVMGAATPAWSTDETFKLTAHGNFSVMIKFYSQTRHWIWPGATQHWTLSDTAQHDFKLSCNSGEKICYGGSYTTDDKVYWGVGYKGDKPCTDCCLTCDNGSHSWTLNDTTTRVCASCNDGSCQCGAGTPDSVCAAHRGNNPSLGCTQQP